MIFFLLLQGKEGKTQKNENYNLQHQVPTYSSPRRSDKPDIVEVWIMRTKDEEDPHFAKKSAQLLPSWRV